ncbi:MAG: acyl--CoA ligase [Acidimicrobiales bacterium]|nr:acyl--CoA ligase [Acidimicrobiales bacterium]MCB9395900.1 acyl--CoA ligase [Acidimicrobiaceae bacterium]
MTDAPINPFEIVEAEVLGVPMKVFAHQPASLRQIWDSSAAHGDNVFLVFEDERITFAQAHRQVRALAHRLSTVHGVRQGDRVAIATRNYPEWAIAYWATVSLGAVAVPLNAWWTGPELAYGLTDSGSVVLFVDDERAERLEPHLAATDVRAVVLIRSERSVPNGELFVDAVLGDDPPLPSVDIAPDDDATIMYTSGTTGRPKGAVQTHRNFGAFLMNGVYRTVMAAASAPPSDTAPLPAATLLTLPLFHVGGLQSFLLPFTASGGKVVLMYKWDADQAVDLIDREQVTSLAGVPTTVFQLLEAAAAKGSELASLTGLSSGATLVPPELVRRIDEQSKSRVAPGNGYGLTETSGAAIANFGPAYVARPDSVGLPISPVIEVRIADDQGSPLPAGEVGEIWLKGPTVIKGYFNLPEATAAAFTDGWFHTGDAGRLDDEGYLYVVDRLKDVVIRGGENIYAAEVEAALYEHPDVTEAAIIGIPHPRLGEEVGAVVRVREGSTLSADDVRAHVGERLAAFKVPSQVWISGDELPRNATGKVLKRQLRESLTADH